MRTRKFIRVLRCDTSRKAGKYMADNQSTNRKIMMQQLERQRRCDDPPYVKEAFFRLSNAGYDEDIIMEMCMWVLAAEYFRALALKQAWDMERYGYGLNRLPVMPWENDGSGYPVDVTREDVQDAIFDNPNLTIETSDQTKERYLHLRSRSRDIQMAMTPLINREMFLKSAKSLGVFDGKTMIDDSKDTLSVVADFCIYANLKQRHKLLKTYRSRHTKSIDPVCKELLDAMGNARYAVLFCQGTLPDLGVQMENLLTGEVICLIDINLAETIKSGLVICSYIIAPYGMYMTTGSPLLVPEKKAMIDVAKIIDEYISNHQLQQNGITDDYGDFAACVISTLLRYEVMEHIKYS